MRFARSLARLSLSATAALSLAAGAQWAANWVITVSFPAMKELSLGMSYGFYAVCAVLSLLFVLRWVKETKGRELDHLGFDVKNIDEFEKRLVAQGLKFEAPPRQVPNTQARIAFLTDPWGTYIEVTEHLAP